ncbi:MAG: hypothetical protein AAF386_04075 [Pseudomonadota bacterium]
MSLRCKLAGSLMGCLLGAGGASADAPAVAFPETGVRLDRPIDAQNCDVADGVFECTPAAAPGLGIAITDTGLVESLSLVWDQPDQSANGQNFDGAISQAIGPFYRGVFSQGHPCTDGDHSAARWLFGAHGTLLVINGYSVSTTSPPCADYVPDPRRWHMVFGTGQDRPPCLLNISQTQSHEQTAQFSDLLIELHTFGWSCQGVLVPNGLNPQGEIK